MPTRFLTALCLVLSTVGALAQMQGAEAPAAESSDSELRVAVRSGRLAPADAQALLDVLHAAVDDAG